RKSTLLRSPSAQTGRRLEFRSLAKGVSVGSEPSGVKRMIVERRLSVSTQALQVEPAATYSLPSGPKCRVREVWLPPVGRFGIRVVFSPASRKSPSALLWVSLVLLSFSATYSEPACHSRLCGPFSPSAT